MIPFVRLVPGASQVFQEEIISCRVSSQKQNYAMGMLRIMIGNVV